MYNIFASYNMVDPPANLTKQSIDNEPVETLQLPSIDDTKWYDNYEVLGQNPSEDAEDAEDNTKDDIKDTTDNDSSGIIDTARQFLGQPYVWGGKSPKTGFDCSGFVGHVFREHGYNIGSSTSQIFTKGQSVKLDNAKVGDIICTKGHGPTGRHVKIISKIDNGQIYTIEAKNKKQGIVESPLSNTNNIVTIRRILG